MGDWFDLNNDGKLDLFEEACKLSHINNGIEYLKNEEANNVYVYQSLNNEQYDSFDNTYIPSVNNTNYNPENNSYINITDSLNKNKREPLSLPVMLFILGVIVFYVVFVILFILWLEYF